MSWMDRISRWGAVAGLSYSVYRLVQEVGLDELAVNSYTLQEAIIHYLYTTGKPLPFGSRSYGGRMLGRLHSDCQFGEVWERLGSNVERCFLLGGVPVWTSYFQPVEGSTEQHFRVKYIRWTLNADNFIREAMLSYEKRCKTDQTGYELHRITKEGHHVTAEDEPCHGSWRPVLFRVKKYDHSNRPRLEDLPLTSDQEGVVTELQRWMESKAFYKEKRIAWRRGYLLHGPPGTGKTTFIRTIGSHLNLPIYSYDLSTFDNESFQERWRSDGYTEPKIVVLEDLDRIFHGEENVTENLEGKLTWDCLLSVLDGVVSNHGIILFVTTNHPDRLDPALAQIKGDHVELRRGRIDRAVHFGFLDDLGVRKIALRTLADHPRLDEIVRRNVGNTVATVQEDCIQEALKLYWGEVRHSKRSRS